MQPQPDNKSGMYSLPEDIDIKAKVSTLARRLEELEGRRLHEVQAMTEVPVPTKPCFIYQSTKHMGDQCPTIPVVREMFVDQANFFCQYMPPTNAPYGSTYNPS